MPCSHFVSLDHWFECSVLWQIPRI
jgi:hypothetical protein